MDKSSKIYIAGHRGLVGSAIWDNLIGKGYTNLIGVTRKEVDLLDSVAVKNFFDREKPEYVVLAAAKVGGIMANNRYRADFIYENIQIQQNVIGESFRHGIKKLLFLGSTCIYPLNAPQPMTEDSLMSSPLEYTNEPYAIAKIAGLKMCESFNIQYNTNYIAVMPTNLYGENDNFHLENSHVMPAMMRKIFLSKCLMSQDWKAICDDLDKRPIDDVDGSASEDLIISKLSQFGVYSDRVELWGSGKAMREFLWSKDMADASVFVLENIDFGDTFESSNKEIRNCHINVGTGKEVSIKQLSEIISDTVGYKGKINFDYSKPDGAMRKLTDPRKLNDMGWQHTIEINEGVRLLYQWYQSSILK